MWLVRWSIVLLTLRFRTKVVLLFVWLCRNRMSFYVLVPTPGRMRFQVPFWWASSGCLSFAEVWTARQLFANLFESLYSINHIFWRICSTEILIIQCTIRCTPPKCFNMLDVRTEGQQPLWQSVSCSIGVEKVCDMGVQYFSYIVFTHQVPHYLNNNAICDWTYFALGVWNYVPSILSSNSSTLVNISFVTSSCIANFTSPLSFQFDGIQ